MLCINEVSPHFHVYDLSPRKVLFACLRVSMCVCVSACVYNRPIRGLVCKPRHQSEDIEESEDLNTGPRNLFWFKACF